MLYKQKKVVHFTYKLNLEKVANILKHNFYCNKYESIFIIDDK